MRNAVAAPHATDGQARQGLARDIQRELKRVGCYDGEVNGEWSANTRQAMKTFIDRVNAALPVDEPDHILRTMVQGHPGHACGVACPSGLSAQQGRCRPSNGIVAQAPAPRAVDGLRARDPAPAPHEIAGGRPSVPRPAWETTVAAAPSAPPAQVNLEGRMAIGAQLPDAPSGHAAARPGVIVLAPSADPRRAAVARAQSGGLAGIIVPGAIAALGGPSTASGAIRTGAIAGAAGLNPGVFPAPAVVIPPDAFEPPVANLPRPRDRDGQPQAARRERPVRTYVPPRPAKFTFPAPSYLIGGNDSKYAASSKTSKGKPFSHFFDWSASGGGGR